MYILYRRDNLRPGVYGHQFQKFKNEEDLFLNYPYEVVIPDVWKPFGKVKGNGQNIDGMMSISPAAR